MELIPKDLRDKWAPAVGNLVIEFGHLEILVSEIVRLSCLPDQFETLRALDFNKRAKLASAALIHWNLADKQKIQSKFSTLAAISGRRNIVVHNGFSMVETKHDGRYFYEFGMSKSYKADDVFLQISDLKKDTHTLNDIHGHLLAWIPKHIAAPSPEEGHQ